MYLLREGVIAHFQVRPGLQPPIATELTLRNKSAVGPRRSTLISLPIFLAVLGISTVVLFNYQKSSSSVVASTLYALRVHPQARDLLGDGISFKNKIPWISGRLSQLHGNIDISYRVKGTKSEGIMHFKSIRRTRMGLVGVSVCPSPAP